MISSERISGFLLILRCIIMKKAIVFVDANNWYHNVKRYFRPGDIDIKKVAKFLCKVKNYNLKEIRWYASIPNITDGEAMYYRHMSFLSSLKKDKIKVITRKLQHLSSKEAIEKKKEIIENLDLCENCKPLVESVFLDLAEFKKKEKGIDVWIAVDTIRLLIIENKCDVCILISGDADFTPALNLIKKNKKEILVAMVPLGFSSELIKKFPYFILRKKTLMNCLRSYKG